jgi:hypothetical protein
MGVIIEPENFENDNTQAKSEEEYYQSLVKTYHTPVARLLVRQAHAQKSAESTPYCVGR